jgi:hypothetical protein
MKNIPLIGVTQECKNMENNDKLRGSKHREKYLKFFLQNFHPSLVRKIFLVTFATANQKVP